MPQLFRDLSVSAVAAGFLAVLVSYAGPLAIFFQAGAAADVSPEMMTSWVWAISMGAAVSGIFLSIWLRAPVVTAWSAPGTAKRSWLRRWRRACGRWPGSVTRWPVRYSRSRYG